MKSILEVQKQIFSDWRIWWAEKSALRKFLPVLSVAIYWTLLKYLGGFRDDHIKIGIVVLLLGYLGKIAEFLLEFLLPFILTGVIYDSQRYYADLIRGPIHVSEPYFFDKRFFGISTLQGVLTPNEWFQLHSHPALDLYTGFWYLFFFSIYILLSFYFKFCLGKKGTRKYSPSQIQAQAPRMGWSFFWLNIAGYSTYYWYAAAPPWYVALYGLGPARLDVKSNAAGCARFDTLLGTQVFASMYGRAADVFGAIPSLHIAYPLLAVYFAFRLGAARIFSIVFFLSMCFSAIYLNHHYVLDVLWGSAYALAVPVLMDAYYDRLKTREKRL